MQTKLTEGLAIEVPVIAAPLGRGSTPDFLAAVADAGAFGFVALRHMAFEAIAQELRRYREATGGRFGVNLTLLGDQRARLDAALDAGVRVFSFWQGDPGEYVGRAKSAGATVFVTVGDPADAASAAAMGVDFIVAQGREAGGHLIGTAPSMTLLPAIVDAAAGVSVVAAGGIADGRGLAAALCLGACGVWMGTRFVASTEAGNHPGYKDAIVAAAAKDTVETKLFDIGWPDAPHRVIRNSTYKNWEEAGCPQPGDRPGEGDVIGFLDGGASLVRYDVSTPWAGFQGDWEATALYAGTGAELIRSVEPVRSIISDMLGSARAAHRAAAAAFS